MAINADSQETFNLRSAAILALETGEMDMNILAHILFGFGAKNITRCHSIEAAKAQVNKGTQFDLVFVNVVLSNGEDGCDFVEWLRRENKPPNRYAPVIMISPHTPPSKVARTRDCGGNYLIAKPLTPGVLLERILWVAQKPRPFVDVPTYVGPDRRFKFTGLPVGQKGRRHDDLSEHLGAATAPNMSQDAIDAMFQPMKVSL